MNEFPMIRVTLEGMRGSILHAFNERQLDMSSELQRALDRECSAEKLQLYVDTTVREVVKEATENAVRHWWMTSETGQNMIMQAISERMEQEAKLWGRKK